MVNVKARQSAIERQIQRLTEQITRRKQKSRSFSWYRLFVFLAGAAGTTFFYYSNQTVLAWICIFLFIVVFNIVAFFHRKIEASLKRFNIYLEYKSSQLARMNLDWEYIEPVKESTSGSSHPYENDLDITGPKSIFHLINGCVTEEGVEFLKQLLLKIDSTVDDILARQSIVKELAKLSHFRNRLLLNFRLHTQGLLQGKELLKSLNHPLPFKRPGFYLVIASILVLTNIVLYTLSQIAGFAPLWIFSLIIYICFYMMNQIPLKSYFNKIDFLDEELSKLKVILKFLENYNYRGNSSVANLIAPILTAQPIPSKQLRKIKFITGLVGLRMNVFLMAVLNLVLPWDFYCAYLTDKHKKRIQQEMPEWLETWYQLDAFCSIANFAYLNPDYTFPRFTSSNSLLETKQLGHPLIKREAKNCNDFSIDKKGDIFIITGSNMSGKSTFLKTVGINLALAFAGAPVNASDFVTSLVRPIACIQINDSISSGFSYFYTEVRRLKMMLDMCQANPDTLYILLIDEIYKGTNNRERLIGSQSFISELISQNCTALVSTHDLELTGIEKDHEHIFNYHFKEEVIESKMKFDYTIRKGPCPTTNALKIMRMEGLRVFDQAP
jgi:hypothetical protein